ncbi:MAG: oxygenase MpaB family protein [Ketobacteraceae bacterium]|nr:oxygenase MpaB family protein [Ketobacteraceae bacterium]
MSEPYPIDREQLIDQLEQMKGRVIDPAAGVFGPDSMFWRLGRYSTAFLGAGRAALLQNAHPWVANAIKQHSRTMDDPLSRFRGTFTNVFKMVYGSLDQVVDSALRVHQIHTCIHGEIEEDSGAFSKGSAYQANEANAMLWVHATLWETTVTMYELIIGELTDQEKERYYQEAKLFAFLFGIPEDRQPPTWQEFLEYNQQMWISDTLTVKEASREISGFLFRFNKPLIPALQRYEVFTAMIMPERLRAQYDLPPPTSENQALFQRYVAMLRKVYPRLPKHLRYLPPYLEAQRRLQGKHRPGLVTGTLNKLMLGQTRLVSA